MLRIYHYEFCLELEVLPPGLTGLPTTHQLPQERSTRMLYLPGTLEKVRAFHLAQGEARKPGICRLYFPEESALQNFWQQYKARFTYIEAAGAVVRDANGHILFIWRRGHWDLPKGKQESTESPESAARRELAEETGLTEVSLEGPLIHTYHIYRERGQEFLKETRWFLFRSDKPHPPVQVQREEGIESYRWVQPSDVPFLYPQSYGTIRDVIEYVLRHVRPAPSR